MIQEELAEEKYTKFSQEVWNSIEKELSLFQKKVTDCMIEVVGDLKKTKEQDFAVRPILDTDVILGQDFYLQMIRPLCVKQHYLPKKLPSASDFIDYQPNSDQQQLMEKNLQKKIVAQNETKVVQNKKGKKGGKNNQNDRQQKMKMQIAKQNFNKDADLMMKSFSFEKLQIEFGFKQEKLQLKLITFFYISAFIKKNRVDLKIQQGTIFEFINILIKVARIYKGLKGPSFFNENQLVQISPTLILDIRMCIDGMKDYYKYDNRKIIIKYPKLVYYTSYDKYFPTLDIKPYGSQIQFIQSCKKAFDPNTGVIKNPVLILYKPMIGSGKTTASIALSQIVRDIKYLDQKNAKFQLVYSCVVSSVRIQVGRYAYSKKQKFALAAMQNYIKDGSIAYPRIINSWSCKNEKIVDLIITDPYSTYQMLDKNYLSQKEQECLEHEKKERKTVVNLGRLQRQNIALFIDQPTAYCRSTQSIATRKIFDILANHPPKLTILSSATMPEQQELHNTIDLIRRVNPGLQVITVSSREFQIGCQYCNFRGDIVFPHTGAKTKQQIQEIISLLKNNAFLLRLYTGPSLFFLIKKCEKIGLTQLPKINELLEVKQQDILKATFRILSILSKQNDDVIQQICKLSADEANIEYKQEVKEKQQSEDEDFFKNLGGQQKQEKQEQQQQQMKQRAQKKEYYINFKKMLRGDAHKFLGGCLIGTADPIKFAHAMFDSWVGEIKPIKRLMDKYKRQCQALQREIRMIQADTQRNQQARAKDISKLIAEKEVLIDFPNTKQINTFDHYKKYCKKKQPVHNTMLIKPVPASNIGQQLIDEVDDFLLKLLFCGVAIFKKSGLSSKYLDKVEQLASLNYLAYIIADQSLCYGTNFPISNIILRDDLAHILSMNDMFQFIGRAGRVGQSWTARAFLQGQGLVMLNNYIKKKDFRNSKQAEIFQQIAQQYLDNPALKLRTLKSQIRYLDRNEKLGSVQILIKKKKQQDADLIKKVSIIPYFVNEGKIKIFSKFFKFENINYYQFPSSEIYYDDLPTTENSKGEPIIDVSSYYKQEVKYIQATINNTVNRVLQQYKDVFKAKSQINIFAGKVYVPFFCRQSNTMTILIKAQSQSKAFQGFEFRELISSGSLKKDEDQIQKFTKIMKQAPRIAKKFMQRPSGMVDSDIKQFDETYSKLISNPLNKFFERMVDYYQQQTKQQFNSAINRLDNREQVSQKILTICQKAIAAEHCNDAINITDKNFFVDKNVRGVWGHVISIIQENP